MGIRLDWEIEAEQSHVRSEGEDPETARARRRTRLRVLGLMLGILVVLGGTVALVLLRLRAAEAEIAQALNDTVEAEVAALRIGDRAAFMGLQRSAAQEWAIQQEAVFNEYQQLKSERNVSLTGRIVDTAVDGSRGRVSLEEIIDGIPYLRVWFYWRYDDGWRHVPPDYTFWGDLQTYQGQGVSVRYRTVDSPLALAVGQHLEQWLRTGCAALPCGTLPTILVELVPDDALQLTWSINNPWLLQMPSPYVQGARLDIPFDLERQLEVANLLADRLVNQVSGNALPSPGADAAFLRQAVVSWLVERFVQVDSQSYLVTSLAQRYGEQAVGRLAQALQPDTNIGVLTQVTGSASLDQSGLDWRDFLTWRLALEDELLIRRDETGFVRLYADPNVALGRFVANLPSEPKTVALVIPETPEDGTPLLHATVSIGTRQEQEEVIFRLVNGVWLRAN